MTLGFTELINSIESEIQFQYLGGAIQWADEHHDGAWSHAMDRFDKALVIAIERMDYKLAKIEGDYYKATVLDLLRKFKASKQMNEADAFLSALAPV